MPKPKMTGAIPIVLAFAGLLLIACQPTAAPTPTPDVGKGGAFEVRSLEEISAGGSPQVVDITDIDAVLTFESSIPLACSVVYGKTTAYGQISVDQDMNWGAHTDHHPLLLGLEPDTEYHYRVQGAAADGTLYVGEDGTFRTLPAEEKTEINLASFEAGARVVAVSSNFGGAENDQPWGADSAIDGQRGTAWSSSGDGNAAFIHIELAKPAQLYAVEVWTRTMSDGTARIFDFTLTTDTGEVIGPFTLADAAQPYRFEVNTTARSLRLDVVDSSGGNTGLIEFAVYGTRYVMLNTNGLRLAQDLDFVHQLADYHPAIYLQFDGLRAETHRSLRGRDLCAVKQQALDNLAEAGLYAVLVATVSQGVNEEETGDILGYGLAHPAVLGVSYQPVTFAGRCLGHHDPLCRYTLPDVLHALEAQTGGLFRVDDFRPVPCPHPTCSASSYAVVYNGTVIPITRLMEVDDYLDFATNRTIPDLSDELQPLMDQLWSMAAMMGSDRTTENLTCVACDLTLPLEAISQFGKESFFLVHVHGFMDEHTFDVKRLMKCCIHELLPDGRAVPFCAYNVLGYREQVREKMRDGG